jgi:cytochrome c556
MKHALLVAGALLLGVGVVSAQQDVVKDRQATMKANGRAVGGTLAPMAKGEKPYDQAAVEAALAVLADCVAKMPNAFPESTKGVKGEGDYSASTKVWDDKAAFATKVASFGKTVAEAKASTKDLDSLKVSVGAIGKECGGCHETFRLKG